MCLVTCIMPTADRRRFVPRAISCFLAQNYPQRELVIIDDGADSVRNLVPEDPRIRYFRTETRQPVGTLRNFACREARGELIAHWDDDDWSASWRLRYQVEQVREATAEICGLSRVWFYSSEEKKAWEYVYPAGHRPWVYGASLCYTRAFWEAHPFREIRLGEDTRFVWADAKARVHMLADSRFLVALIHGGNTSRKRTPDARYQPRPVADIDGLLGEDAASFFSGDAVTPVVRKPRALISAALGIGDILRMTPLIRVAHRLGYDVDALLATDYPDVVRLLEGAPEIRQIFHLPSKRRRGGVEAIEGLREAEYDVAAFTTWSAPLRNRLRTRRALAFDRAQWLKEGDSRSVERIARDLGWKGEMPEPFAIASGRCFELLPGTVAIHPGCKVEWPWKKWHGFDELARKFPNVVIVGSEEDLRTDGTYFRRDFAWPEHAQNFVGKLNLPDTAALLRACATLVSNDSGLMQLGLALGVPTFGIFGITSPAREAMRSKYFHAITKGLPCEAACHAGKWGRRDCDRHLECLKTLTAEEVYMKVTEIVPAVANGHSHVATTQRAKIGSIAVESIDLLYYANVFDASGYGQAARAYIHALNAAGVNVGVVNLAHHAAQVRDPLVESLAGRKVDADFHLFHGIPPLWARRAFPLRNVIAMTVWETDAMPPQWRPALNHAIDVWLPCQFNASVFERTLGKTVFKLPHAWFPNESAPASNFVEACGVRKDDYVFYSIFDWQERKGPHEMIEAFLRAFPNGESVVLVLKTNPGAAAISKSVLTDLRCRVPSQARIELKSEAWSEEQIAALQERGDCYVSLHRGEGWNYPLFEAAGRGKSIVATGFSGPTDYLDATVHRLVRHRPAAVRQRYAFYSTSMHWAEPEMEHAVEMLRAAFGERKRNDGLSAAAERIRRNFAPEIIGECARQRLMQLLHRTNSAKWERLDCHNSRRVIAPPIPIPGSWYDADYFEYGRKSNWRDGYTWSAFAGLFRDTGEFLTTMFPEAESYLDAGCAKGFLVRTLRERGKEASGFDHSAWAIERAEESARPFLRLAKVEEVEFDRKFDLLLCFFLLESLTEEQAHAFLKRARSWTHHALVAVIHTCEGESSPKSRAGDDYDLSHITLESRAWWHDLILRAGWRQDALHRLVQCRTQSQMLPMRMNWKLFIYAPGN
jgi:ADP-heptose:LPS heptosyltransferase/2-polyprenyl-3-methyl-5-hydroxy-6-metoxy-1,4-benzoquinol methylase